MDLVSISSKEEDLKSLPSTVTNVIDIGSITSNVENVDEEMIDDSSNEGAIEDSNNTSNKVIIIIIK